MRGKARRIASSCPQPSRGESGRPETSDGFRRRFGLGFGRNRNGNIHPGNPCPVIASGNGVFVSNHGDSFSAVALKRFSTGVKVFARTAARRKGAVVRTAWERTVLVRSSRLDISTDAHEHAEEGVGHDLRWRPPQTAAKFPSSGARDARDRAPPPLD
ncbi:hypothetical protein IE4771_CH04433 [Rhizobium etli bv. mimosae str. IE4771]|uniref:Uncharacterized protein n=1 Tax=Rhizobium etli bv. mimosae str. IE4771 TaxID=1432050 RepID=A0A060I2R3_RHIET|nr:hypothetical protein IE4771_CH04433 [Rhizobium sp. IE4771]